MFALSMDLRQRVVAAAGGGVTEQRGAGGSGVPGGAGERRVARRRRTGSLAPTVQRHGPPPLKRAGLHAWLPARLEGAADATLAEHAAAVTTATDMTVALATMSRAISRLPAEAAGAGLTPRGRRRRAGRPLKQKA